MALQFASVCVIHFPGNVIGIGIGIEIEIGWGPHVGSEY